MDEGTSKENLYIPQGLKRKREYFEGYGNSEFRITIIVAIVAVIVCYMVYAITKNQVLAIFLFLVIPSTTVLFIIRDGSNVSVVDQIKFMVRYAKSQKKYKYVYRNEWK